MKPVTILVGALGGDGGGVLCDWIVDAAQSQGLGVQATQIPGLNATQMPYLSTTNISSMNATQIAAFTTNQVQNMMTEAQVEAYLA